jgi:antitoxin component YwqK of YwqJK toxin-antitoxin module
MKILVLLAGLICSQLLTAQTKKLETYYFNGKLKSEYIYTDESNYIVKNYYSNGQLMEKGQFEGGLMSGVWIRYDEKGQVQATGSYDKGLKQGEWVIYNPVSMSKTYVQYDKNRIIRSSETDAAGNVIAERVNNQ